MATKTKTIYGPKPTEVSVTQKQTTGTNIATITVNGTATELYAPNGGSDGGTSTDNVAHSRVESYLDLTKDDYDELKKSPVGTKKTIPLSTTISVESIELPGRYSESNYETEGSSHTGRFADATIPCLLYFGAADPYTAFGYMTVTWQKLDDNDAQLTISFNCNTVVIYQDYSLIPSTPNYLFGSVAIDPTTSEGISFDSTTHVFAITPSDIPIVNFDFTLYNSIESGGSGSGAGVSDVDWTGQYTADNGVELGTLTITTTD